MIQYSTLLKQTPLFAGIAEDELSGMLRCLGASEKKYKKDEFILMAGDPVRSLGIVVSGTARIEREDAEGLRLILTELGPGDIFAEAFACAGILHSPVSVVAAVDCTVLFLQFARLVTTCPSSCVFHGKLIENMMRLLASKNILLNERIQILSRRTIREKLMAYFLFQTVHNGKSEFSIPFSRNELADYLCADRSALSRELSRMREEGILRYSKNQFELLD